MTKIIALKLGIFRSIKKQGAPDNRDAFVSHIADHTNPVFYHQGKY
jgi:hypothetical protein